MAYPCNTVHLCRGVAGSHGFPVIICWSERSINFILEICKFIFSHIFMMHADSGHSCFTGDIFSSLLPFGNHLNIYGNLLALPIGSHRPSRGWLIHPFLASNTRESCRPITTPPNQWHRASITSLTLISRKRIILKIGSEALQIGVDQ